MEPFHVSNCRIGELLTRVQTAIRDDADFFGSIVQETVLQKRTGEYRHLITRFNTLRKGMATPVSETREYDGFFFSRQAFSLKQGIERLLDIKERKLKLSGKVLTLPENPGCGQYPQFGHNTYSEWPVNLFEVRMGSVDRPDGYPLLDFDLPAYANVGAAVSEFLDLHPFYQEDGRFGSILITIPSFRARIRNLSIKNRGLRIEIQTSERLSDLRLKIAMSRPGKSMTVTPESAVAEIKLESSPSEVKVWLMSARYGVMDFAEESLVRRTPPDQARLLSVAFDGPDVTRSSNRVFIVHGHDDGVKEAVARFVERCQLEAVILHEQPNAGKTIIEKFEKHADVAFAIVLLTPDDTTLDGKRRKKRARQNVILELGFFLGRLGRANVCALYKEGVERPSDYDGVLYIPFDKNGAWRSKLAGELHAAGFQFDAKLALQ